MAQYNHDEINNLFQQALGRNGTDAEHSFLSDYVSQGYLSPGQIGQYLQGTPEAQQGRLGQQTQQYGDLMTKNNQMVLGQAADAAQSQFAQNGRQFSTGQGNAILQAGQQLAAGQSSALANFYGNGAMGLNNNYAATGQGALQRAYNLKDTQDQFSRDLYMYDRQRNDSMDMLNTQNRQNLQSGLIMAGANLPGQFLGAVGRRAGGGA